jgi:hypothetical protein
MQVSRVKARLAEGSRQVKRRAMANGRPSLGIRGDLRPAMQSNHSGGGGGPTEVVGARSGYQGVVDQGEEITAIPLNGVQRSSLWL